MNAELQNEMDKEKKVATEIEAINGTQINGKVDPKELPLEESIEEMKEFMADNPGDIPETLVAEDQGFAAEIVKEGAFVNINYMNSGSAAIEQKDGSYFLVLGDDFDTPNGPDLVLYLTKNSDPTTRSDISQGIEIGKLKSTTGMQVYELGDINLDEYNSVSIHCRAFNVPWSYAPLN